MYEPSVLDRDAPSGTWTLSVESPAIFNICLLIVTKSSESKMIVWVSLSVKSYPSKLTKAVRQSVKSFSEFADKSQIIQSKSDVSDPPSILTEVFWSRVA